MPVISSILRYHTLLLVTPKYVCSWLQSNYNITLPFECLQSNPLKLLMHKLYFPLEARLGSFITGAMVAIKIAQVSHEQGQYSTWKKFFIFNMIFLYSLLTVTQRLDSPNLSEFALNFTIATSRTILAISVAFILFTAICPPMHSYHAPWIRLFLSSRIWIPISKLSYLAYLIHWPITFEMLFSIWVSALYTYRSEVSAHVQVRLQTCLNHQSSLETQRYLSLSLKCLNRLQFIIGYIEIQSSHSAQFYNL
ncbi:unnamed protein product [Rotaria sp. Silwood1]|nr:unnamed protein product [Rotaria sp. Silwood1]